MSFSRVPLCRVSQYTSLCLRSRTFFPLLPISFSTSIATLTCPSRSSITTRVVSAQDSLSFSKPLQNCWKPMCLYFTQGKCTMMDDPLHLEKFNHSCSQDLQVDPSALSKMRSQEFDYFLVLDLEGKVEILEFPVVIINAKTMEVVDFFHRFVRPSVMNEQRINEYIQGKYGKFGVDRVWHDTAMDFTEVLGEFEAWLTTHHLWEKHIGGSLNKAAFVTCGNWDLKTKIPEQCKVSKTKLPSYFMEWINLKDVYLNFYNTRAPGMMSMMKQLEIPAMGSHHLGFDDTKNICRILQRLLSDGALIHLTARRTTSNTVDFLCEHRFR